VGVQSLPAAPGNELELPAFSLAPVSLRRGPSREQESGRLGLFAAHLLGPALGLGLLVFIPPLVLRIRVRPEHVIGLLFLAPLLFPLLLGLGALGDPLLAPLVFGDELQPRFVIRLAFVIVVVALFLLVPRLGRPCLPAGQVIRAQVFSLLFFFPVV
jgi:hypothetical protein